jgi:hypothetical protein
MPGWLDHHRDQLPQPLDDFARAPFRNHLAERATCAWWMCSKNIPPVAAAGLHSPRQPPSLRIPSPGPTSLAGVLGGFEGQPPRPAPEQL